jgi:hypothetical protein
VPVAAEWRDVAALSAEEAERELLRALAEEGY